MRKKKRIISICMAALVVLLAIAGCGKKESLVGKWVYTDEATGQTSAMEVFNDGTAVTTEEGVSYSCVWTTERGRLKLEVETGIFGKLSHVYDYELDGDTLILTDENGVYMFTRE